MQLHITRITFIIMEDHTRIILKNIRLSTQPCLTPTVELNALVILSLLHFIENKTDEYISSIILRNLPDTPHFINLYIIKHYAIPYQMQRQSLQRIIYPI